METNSEEDLVLVFFFNPVGQIEEYADPRLTISLSKSELEMVPMLSVSLGCEWQNAAAHDEVCRAEFYTRGVKAWGALWVSFVKIDNDILEFDWGFKKVVC